MGRAASGLVALLFVVSLGTGAVASANEPDPGSTTTTTTAPPDSTTTTTAPVPPDPGSTTTTTVPVPPEPGSTTTTTAPADDPTRGGDSPPDTVPVVNMTVPPRSGRYANQGTQSQVIRRQLRVARATALQTQAVHDAAVARVQQLDQARVALEDKIDGLRVEERVAIRRLQRAQDLLAQRAVEAYVRGRSSELTTVLSAHDANDYFQRATLLRSMVDADIAAVEELRAAKAAVRGDLADTAEALRVNTDELAKARADEVVAATAVQTAQFELKVFAAGSEIVITGFTFPVDDPHEFTDSFGVPRMMGSPFEHWHEGVDILAPFGTKLFATERGVISKMGSDLLGGIKLWLKGESGTYYYYAHLRNFSPGIKEGVLVEAGAVLGFVGDTGNAKGGPPHCHFEIHPGGGPAVNPYPLLAVVDEMREQQLRDT